MKLGINVRFNIYIILPWLLREAAKINSSTNGQAIKMGGGRVKAGSLMKKEGHYAWPLVEELDAEKIVVLVRNPK